MCHCSPSGCQKLDVRVRQQSPMSHHSLAWRAQKKLWAGRRLACAGTAAVLCVFCRVVVGSICGMASPEQQQERCAQWTPGVYTYGITSRVWSTATKESLGYEGSYMALTRVRGNLKRLFTWFDDFLQAGACWADVTKYCRFIMLMNHVISFHEFWEAPGFTCRQ